MVRAVSPKQEDAGHMSPAEKVSKGSYVSEVEVEYPHCGMKL